MDFQFSQSKYENSTLAIPEIEILQNSILFVKFKNYSLTLRFQKCVILKLKFYASQK